MWPVLGVGLRVASDPTASLAEPSPDGPNSRVQVLDQLARACDQRQWKYTRLDVAQSIAARQKTLEEFGQTDQSAVFFSSPRELEVLD